MKNTTLFVSALGLLTLTACGSSYVASQSASGYTNSIYSKGGTNSMESIRNDRNLANLKEKTSETIYDSKNNTQTIFVGDTNVVDVSYNPNYTYAIVDDDESYESRLKKFDSPTYTINIEFDNDWYDWYDYAWYNPWYNPWYYYPGWSFTWRTSWYWHSPFWYDSYWYWNYPWYYPPYYYGFGYYDPWWPGYAPLPPHHNYWRPPYHDSGRNPVYYGRRENTPTYKATANKTAGQGGGSYIRRDPSMNAIRGNAAMSTTNKTGSTLSTPVNSGGSSYRRVPANGASTSSSLGHTGVRYNNSAINSGSGKPANMNTNPTGSMYRRASSTTKSTGSTSSNYSYSSGRNNSSSYSTGNSSYNRNQGSSYRRNSASQIQSSSYNSSSFSGRSTFSAPASGSAGRSSGVSSGGSSFRRR